MHLVVTDRVIKKNSFLPCRKDLTNSVCEFLSYGFNGCKQKLFSKELG